MWSLCGHVIFTFAVAWKTRAVGVWKWHKLREIRCCSLLSTTVDVPFFIWAKLTCLLPSFFSRCWAVEMFMLDSCYCWQPAVTVGSMASNRQTWSTACWSAAFSSIIQDFWDYIFQYEQAEACFFLSLVFPGFAQLQNCGMACWEQL